ncbi:GTP-binding protein [Dactylosporangium sp. NPDC050688]|uniref:GTP-binding protein n=1 Tax=Dactylosporangium sp. NPDC050688 TaxID=3157217 RepID=UPI0033D222C1
MFTARRRRRRRARLRRRRQPQTGTLALERRRGITIKSAVVSFTVDVTVNLIDVPGHPDFIAEEYGLDVVFRDTTTICIELPAGTGYWPRQSHAHQHRAPLPQPHIAGPHDRAAAGRHRGARARALFSLPHKGCGRPGARPVGARGRIRPPRAGSSLARRACSPPVEMPYYPICSEKYSTAIHC